MTPLYTRHIQDSHAAISDLEYLAAHLDPARASEAGRILRESLAAMAELLEQLNTLQMAHAQMERELERIQSRRKHQKILAAQAKEAVERLLREVGG